MDSVTAWFAGPKAENGDRFSDTIRRIVDDYYAWRRNYFPEDGVVIDSAHRRANEAFEDSFDDRLMELLGRLKADFPAHSPRYAAHMLAEQTLPSVAGYFAAMLYNPNNVTAEAAPVTVQLELEAASLIARMVGYGDDAWAHLTGGGTVANIEVLWIARTVLFLPFVVRDMRQSLGLAPDPDLPEDRLLGMPPLAKLESFRRCFAEGVGRNGGGREGTAAAIAAYLASPHNVVERGVSEVAGRTGVRPVVLVPESHHYCFEKAMDILGLGRDALVSVPVDHRFRMNVAELSRKLDGGDVLAVVPVVGSTEEGAVDPVHEVLALRASREAEGAASFWVHADAAYGGYLRTMTIPSRCGLGEPSTTVSVDGVPTTLSLNLPQDDVCAALEALGGCDSVTVDPHKLGYVPYPAGAVCFRSDVVKPLVRQDAPYIQEAPEDVEAERKSEGIGVYILEGSKPGAAAASVWLSHSLIPLDIHGHGRLIRESVRNACELHALLESFPAMSGPVPVRAVPLCEPDANIVCYAFVSDVATDLGSINQLNRKVYDRFSLDSTSGKRIYDQRFFVSRTTLTPSHYSLAAVQPFLRKLGVTDEEYERLGVFLLRSVCMNPWYEQGKRKGRYYLSELVAELFSVAEELGR